MSLGRGRMWRAAAAVAAMALVVAACGADEGEDDPAAAEAEPVEAADDEPDEGAVEEPGEAAGDQDPVQLRMAWWGGDLRHDLTNQALDLFEDRHPHISVEREFSGFSGYLDRVLTQFAGQSPPDVFQVWSDVLREFVDRGQLLDLGTVSPDPLNTDTFTPELLEGGMVDGTLYAMVFGTNTQDIVYNADLFDEHGIEHPQDGWTWDDLADLGAQVTEATGGDVHGVRDLSFNPQTFEVFVKQRGGNFLDGQGLAFERDDLVDWWTMWADMRETGAASPPDITAEYDTGWSIMTAGDAAMTFTYANQINAVIGESNFEVGMVLMPEGTDTSGQYLRPAMHLTVASSTDHPEEAAMLMDFLLNDPEANEILGLERGYPGSAEVEEIVTEGLDEPTQRFADLMTHVREVGAATPEPAPPGAADVISIFTEVAERLAFGQLSVDEAADEFFQRAEAELGS